MKNIYMAIVMALFVCGGLQAQVGLEAITIEEYFTSTSAEENDPDFPVRTGSVTYRIYVDMATGWELQAIFGATNVGTGEIDELRFETTTDFFNNEDRGDLYGYNIGDNRLPENTVALDSWLSTGRSSGATEGVLLGGAEDADAGAPVIPHDEGYMVIFDTNSEDGNTPNASPNAATNTWTPTPGFEAIVDPVLGDIDANGSLISVTDGALGITQTLQGPTAANRVLIGQFTTDGVFSGKLNLQIREVGTTNVEVYVAETPQGGEFTFPGLIFGPNDPPTVAITAPANNANVAANTLVNITANADDTDGSVTQVEFFVNSSSIGVDNAAPYEASYTTDDVASTDMIEAVVTDNGGAQATDQVSINTAGNTPPAVVLTAPASAIIPDVVNISATATDSDGISGVEFFLTTSGVRASIGVDNTAPYEASFTSAAGQTLIEAVATDNLGAEGSDSQVFSSAANQSPTATITAPLDGAVLAEGVNTIVVSASDSDGSIAQVEFFVDGSSIGIDNDGAPFDFDWNAVFPGGFGDVVLTAVATDDRGATGNAAAVNVRIADPSGAPYQVGDVTQECSEGSACLPIQVIGGGVSDVIGFDIEVSFDNTKMFPTGNIIKSSDLIGDSTLFEVDNAIDLANGKMTLSVFLDVSAPFGTSFNGAGDLLCIEFQKRPTFGSEDASSVSITRLQESFFDQVFLQPTAGIAPGTYTTFRDTTLSGQLQFWKDNSAINADNVATTIAGDDASCLNPSTGTAVSPLTDGTFEHDLTTGLNVNIDRNYALFTDVIEVVNGFDALLGRRLLLDDPSFVPSVFQIIALDVNRDGVVSSGDISQINQRAVNILDEFRQVETYNADGSLIGNANESKDWSFVAASTVIFNPAYQISSTFPIDNGVGYSKNRVPVVPFCAPAPVSNFAVCPQVGDEIYYGILIGDVDGNYENTADVLLRSNESVKLDLGSAVYTENFVDVPVSFASIDDINSVDLRITFDETKLAFNSIVSNGLQAVGHVSKLDGVLRVTSNSLNALETGETVFYVRFENLAQQEVTYADFNEGEGFLNGAKVYVDFANTNNGSSSSDEEVKFNIYPNPTTGMLFIDISTDVTAEVIDMNGRIVMSNRPVAADSKERLDLSNLPSGMYTVRVFSDEYTSAKRVFIGN